MNLEHICMAGKKVKVVTVHSSFAIGGAENMVYELAKSLDPKKVDMTVITLHSRLGNSLEKKVDEAGISVIYVGCEGRVTPAKLLRVYRMINNENPDVVHAHMSGVVYSILWTLWKGHQMIVTAHTTPDKAFNERTTRILKTLAKHRKAVLVAVSDENRRLMEEHYGLMDDNVKSINNGIDISRYRHESHDGIVFINVGRHDENKNQSLIIALFAKVHQSYPDTRLILCGDGPEHERLRDQAMRLGVFEDIDFTGNVGNVQDYLARSDIYLVASHREGLPLSAVEAMASSLPVISTDVGGMKNIVRENGILVKDHDEDGYCKAMMYFVGNEKARVEMGQRSLEIAQEFSSKNMSDQYTKLYESCAKERKHG